MGLGLLLKRLEFGEQMGKVLARLALLPAPLPGMDLTFGRDLGDRFFLFEHLQHGLCCEGCAIPLLLWHDRPSTAQRL